ncbi:hypothetical protein [Agromyces sp. NPDC049794]|uniref:hypothetical protein n=1 Tax=unclassified Agromyces TaxID=2639701 RepID=UPI00340775AC
MDAAGTPETTEPTETTNAALATATAEPQPRRLPAWAPVLIGVASALLGLLPWLITGMRLPLQNLWATDTSPDRYPLVLLPFSQYAITLITAIIVTGAAIAGIVARATRKRLPRFGAAAIVIGVLAVQIIATVQTSIVVRDGLQERGESALYLAALVAGTSFAILVGVLVLLLIAKAPRAGAVVGLSIAAVAVGPWINGLVVPFGTAGTTELAWLLDVTRWIPPVLIGAAIAWGGVNTVGRVLAAAFALLALWVAPALMTAISNAVGSRVLARHPAEMLDYGLGVFGMALWIPELALPPLIVAVAVAAVGLVGRAIVTRRRRGAEQVEPLPR